MAGEWRESTLGDFVAIQRGHDLTEEERRAGSVPVMGSAGQNGCHDTAMARGPGVVIGRSGGSFGRVHCCPVDYWPHNTVLYVTDFRGNDPCFVYYRLKSLDFSGYNSGSAQQSLNRNHIYSMRIRVPRLSQQRAIAHILGTLDDKIELNRRMNEALEAMARALFKSWFVDFDPVRAKAEGRDLGLPAVVADLFPNRFQSSELGEIPAGWTVAALGDLCQRVAMGPFGSDIKTDNFIEFGVPVVRGSSLTNGFVDDGFVFVSESKADSLRNANALPGDIVVTHRGTLGQVGLIPKPSRFPRYVVSQSQMLIAADPDLVTARYVFEYLRSPAGQHALLANTSQTGVPAIARPTTSVRAIRLVLPPLKVTNSFERLLQPLVERGVGATQESRTLAAIRDALLPKLLSGQIRVKEAEELVEAQV